MVLEGFINTLIKDLECTRVPPRNEFQLCAELLSSPNDLALHMYFELVQNKVCEIVLLPAVRQPHLIDPLLVLNCIVPCFWLHCMKDVLRISECWIFELSHYSTIGLALVYHKRWELPSAECNSKNDGASVT